MRRRIAFGPGWICALIAALSIAVGAAKIEPRQPLWDENFYLGYAYGLAEYGTFGRVMDPDVAPEPTVYSVPLYPSFLAGLMTLDGRASASTACALARQRSPDGPCPAQYELIWGAQLLLVALTVVLAWLAARAVSERPVVAHLAAALTALSGVPAYFANLFLTENLTLPLMTGCAWCLVLGLGRNRFAWLALSGALLGLAALTRPAFFYLVFPLAMLVLAVAAHRYGRRSILIAVVFALPFAALSGAWSLRDRAVAGDVAMAGTYGARAITARLAYNRMNAKEWLTGFIYWLPDFGDKWAAALTEPAAYERLRMPSPKGFLPYERTRLIDEARAANGGTDATLGWYLEQKILGDLGKHLAVSLVLAWRGLFIGQYFGLFGAFFLAWAVWRAIRRGDMRLPLLAAPAVLMLGLNAFISLNIPRYNVQLVPVMAVALSIGLVQIWSALAERWVKRKG